MEWDLFADYHLVPNGRPTVGARGTEKAIFRITVLGKSVEVDQDIIAWSANGEALIMDNDDSRLIGVNNFSNFLRVVVDQPEYDLAL